MRLGKPQKHKISDAAIQVFKNSYGDKWREKLDETVKKRGIDRDTIEY